MPRLVALICMILAPLALAACESPPVNRDASKPLTVAARVDLERYLGRWYEVARFPNSFERDCFAVTATYSRNRDGSVGVMNRCRKGGVDGPEEIADGTATVVDGVSNAKLSVTFFWPFSGDYWVLEVSQDYQWALVGEPSGRFLWILSRSPQLDGGTRASLIGKLKAQGYNTDALYWTPQPAA